MQGISLVMTPEGTITGRVVDANGDPLSRASVQALKVAYQFNGRALVTVESVPSDDNGNYRLFWLPPGQYYISATPADDRLRTLPVMLPSASSSSITITLARDSATGPIPGLVPGVKVTGRTL